MARKLIASIALFLLVVAISVHLLLKPPPPIAVPDRGASIKGAMLVVPGGGRSGPFDVEVVGSKITRIAPAADGAVKSYLLPGLSDAHMHGPAVPWPGHEELFAFLYLYHGVTLTRMASGDTAMRDNIERGDYPGPRILTCGPFLDGDPPLWRSSLVVPRDYSAHAAVAKVQKGGYDCVKVYNELTAEASEDIYMAAAALGLPVIGHVPWRQDFAQAQIDDLQHLIGWATTAVGDDALPPVLRLRSLSQLSQARIDFLVEAAVAREFQLTPTLITLQRKATLGDADFYINLHGADLLPEFYSKKLWHPRRGLVSSRLMSPQDHQNFREALPRAYAAVRQLHAAGVEIHAGTDSPAEAIVPGAGLIEELALLRAAGLSPEQVLEITAVRAPQRMLGDDNLRLAEGATANFILYARDPSVDLANLSSRTAVVADGRFYDRALLEAQLARYQHWFNSGSYRWLTGAVTDLGLGLLNLLATTSEPSGATADEKPAK